MRSHELLRDDSQPIGIEISKLGAVAPKEHLIRFGFGAILAAAAGGIGMLFGPKAGGLFLAFPAILPASLTLIEKKEGKAEAWADASGGVIGAIGLAGFAGTAYLLLKAAGPVLALAAALAVWTGVSLAIYAAVRATRLDRKVDEHIAKE